MKRILVTGAHGLIGREVVAGLSQAGFETIGVVRPTATGPSSQGVRCIGIDLAVADAETWAPALEGVDCVVNTVGAFAAGPGQSMHVHDAGAGVLFRACVAAGVRRVIHFSAIGVQDALTPFARTKLAGDHALTQTSLDWVILRPSIVLGRAPAGGSALIRGLAAVPVVPRAPSGPIAPVLMEDVVASVVALAATNTPIRRAVDVVGPEQLSFHDVVAQHRAWFGWRPAMGFSASRWLMALVYAGGDMAGALGWRSPIRSTGAVEVERGGIGDPTAWIELTGVKPRRLQDWFAANPASLQERRFAQFYFLKPLIILATAIFWIATGVASLTFGYDIGKRLLEAGGLGALSSANVIAGGITDLLIGAAILYRPTARFALYGAILVSLFYAVAGTLLLPRLWLDPLGPLLKILPLITLNLVALVLVRDR